MYLIYIGDGSEQPELEIGEVYECEYMVKDGHNWTGDHNEAEYMMLRLSKNRLFGVKPSKVTIPKISKEYIDIIKEKAELYLNTLMEVDIQSDIAFTRDCPPYGIKYKSSKDLDVSASANSILATTIMEQTLGLDSDTSNLYFPSSLEYFVKYFIVKIIKDWRKEQEAAHSHQFYRELSKITANEQY